MHRLYTIFSLLAALFSWAIISGCETPLPSINQGVNQPQYKTYSLDFIKNGITTRETILNKLGRPSAQFEDGRIITYFLKADKNDQWRRVIPKTSPKTGYKLWTEETASLVLVFGDDNVLVKHSLVVSKQ